GDSTTRARATLRRLLSAPQCEVRGVAAMGLGLAGEAKDVDALTELAGAREAGTSARAAAITALGLTRGEGQAKAAPHVEDALDAREPAVRSAALLSAARLVRGGALGRERFDGAVARAAFGPDDQLRGDAVLA